jgi:hypothetical protein
MIIAKYHILPPDLSIGARPTPLPRRDSTLRDRPPFVVARPSGVAIPAPTLSLPNVRRPAFRTAVQDGKAQMLIPQGVVRTQLAAQHTALTAATTSVLPGLEVIGCGYNVFGMQAEPSCLKRPLLDPQKVQPSAAASVGGRTYQHYPITTVHALSGSRRSTVHGVTLSEHSQELSTRAGLSGGFLGFHAQAEVAVKTVESETYYSEFTDVCETIWLWDIMLNTGNLRQYVLAEALQAIDTWTPENLFDEFGLYFLTGIVIGGRINYVSSTDTFHIQSQTNIAMAAEASYLGFVTGSVASSNQTSVSSFNQYSRTVLTTIGGDPTKGGTSINDPAGYQAFKDSVGVAPVLVDFTLPSTKQPLKPIWDLVDPATPARRDALIAASTPYAARMKEAYGSIYTITGGPRLVSYLVTTKTSNEKDSCGTDSNVYVRLIGVDRFGHPTESGQLKHDDGRNNHERGMTDIIAFDLVPDVGSLTNIGVDHDGTRDAPAWRLESIAVDVPHLGMKYGMRCDRWFDGNSAVIQLLPA